jgi:hypothetical protein
MRRVNHRGLRFSRDWSQWLALPLAPGEASADDHGMKWAKTRWLLAAGCLVFSWKLMAAGLRMEGLGAAPHVFFSVIGFLVTVLITSPETAFRLAEWCSRPFAAILFPSDEFAKPPLTYRLARRYRDEKRWEDAARQYRKIIRYYPKERDAYLELLDVAAQMGDRKLKRKYAALFQKRFAQGHEKLSRREEEIPHAAGQADESRR